MQPFQSVQTSRTTFSSWGSGDLGAGSEEGEQENFMAVRFPLLSEIDPCYANTGSIARSGISSIQLHANQEAHSAHGKDSCQTFRCLNQNDNTSVQIPRRMWLTSSLYRLCFYVTQGPSAINWMSSNIDSLTHTPMLPLFPRLGSVLHHLQR